MSEHSSPEDVRALLEHSVWLRRLARSLAGDRVDADDLVQDALGAAIRTRRPIRDVRGFLAGVLRRRSAEIRRGEARRRAREAAASESTGAHAPSTSGLVERSETMRIVLEEIERLPAAQRDVLLMRYIDDMAPAEIARRRGVAPATVRAQLARGLEGLRRSLDRRHASRGNWLAALAPFRAATDSASSIESHTLRSATPLLQSGVLMSKTLLAIVAVPVVLVAAWAVIDGSSPTRRAATVERATSPDRADLTAVESERPARSTSESVQRERADSVERDSVAEVAPLSSPLDDLLDELAAAGLSEDAPDLGLFESAIETVADALRLDPDSVERGPDGAIRRVRVTLANSARIGELDLDGARARMTIGCGSAAASRGFLASEFTVAMGLEPSDDGRRFAAIQHHVDTRRQPDAVLEGRDHLVSGWACSIATGATLRSPILSAAADGGGWRIGVLEMGPEPITIAAANLLPFDRLSRALSDELDRIAD